MISDCVVRTKLSENQPLVQKLQGWTRAQTARRSHKLRFFRKKVK